MFFPNNKDVLAVVHYHVLIDLLNFISLSGLQRPTVTTCSTCFKSAGRTCSIKSETLKEKTWTSQRILNINPWEKSIIDDDCTQIPLSSQWSYTKHIKLIMLLHCCRHLVILGAKSPNFLRGFLSGLTDDFLHAICMSKWLLKVQLWLSAQLFRKELDLVCLI